MYENSRSQYDVYNDRDDRDRFVCTAFYLTLQSNNVFIVICWSNDNGYT